MSDSAFAGRARSSKREAINDTRGARSGTAGQKQSAKGALDEGNQRGRIGKGCSPFLRSFGDLRLDYGVLRDRVAPVLKQLPGAGDIEEGRSGATAHGTRCWTLRLGAGLAQEETFGPTSHHVAGP